MEEDRLDEAINHLTKAVEIEPNNAVIHYNLAKVLTNKDRLEEAAKEYRKVLQLEPGNTAAQEELKNISSKQQSGQAAK